MSNKKLKLAVTFFSTTILMCYCSFALAADEYRRLTVVISVNDQMQTLNYTWHCSHRLGISESDWKFVSYLADSNSSTETVVYKFGDNGLIWFKAPHCHNIRTDFVKYLFVLRSVSNPNSLEIYTSTRYQLDGNTVKLLSSTIETLSAEKVDTKTDQSVVEMVERIRKQRLAFGYIDCRIVGESEWKNFSKFSEDVKGIKEWEISSTQMGRKNGHFSVPNISSDDLSKIPLRRFSLIKAASAWRMGPNAGHDAIRAYRLEPAEQNFFGKPGDPRSLFGGMIGQVIVYKNRGVKVNDNFFWSYDPENKEKVDFDIGYLPDVFDHFAHEPSEYF